MRTGLVNETKERILLDKKPEETLVFWCMSDIDKLYKIQYNKRELHCTLQGVTNDRDDTENTQDTVFGEIC